MLRFSKKLFTGNYIQLSTIYNYFWRIRGKNGASAPKIIGFLADSRWKWCFSAKNNWIFGGFEAKMGLRRQK